VWHVWEVLDTRTCAEVVVAVTAVGDVTGRWQAADGAGVASVQQNKVGVAGLQDECDVPVYNVQVGRHVAFTL